MAGVIGSISVISNENVALSQPIQRNVWRINVVVVNVSIQ